MLAQAAACAADQAPPDLAQRQGIDWPDFLGPERNGKSAETGQPRLDPAAPPPIVWQCELRESHGAPSIARGRLFHFDRYGQSNRLTCRRSETGETLWTYEYRSSYLDQFGAHNGPRTTPVVDDDRVYVQGPEGEIHCVRVADGTRLWSVDTLEQFGVVPNFFGVGSTPLVWNDLLLANVGGSPPGSPRHVYAARGGLPGNGSGIVAFDKLTGAVRWQASDELASYASPIVASIEGTPMCLALARGGLVGVDARSGRVAFQFPHRAKQLESVNASTPVASGNEVFISEAYGPGSALVRCTPDGCAAVWQDRPNARDQALALYWNTPILHDGFLYGSSGQYPNQAELRCIEWQTGKLRWSAPDLGRASLLYVDGRLICLSEDGVLRVIRATPERYELLAEWELRDEQGRPLLAAPARTAPVLARGLLYVRGADRLVCLEWFPQDNTPDAGQ
jgi:outer membrane protein assembly factor BamB